MIFCFLLYKYLLILIRLHRITALRCHHYELNSTAHLLRAINVSGFLLNSWSFCALRLHRDRDIHAPWFHCRSAFYLSFIYNLNQKKGATPKVSLIQPMSLLDLISMHKLTSYTNQGEFIDYWDHVWVLWFLHAADQTVTKGHNSLRMIVCTFPLLKLSSLWFWIVHKEPILYHEKPARKKVQFWGTPYFLSKSKKNL